jgi:hypothetical protein
MGSNCRFPKNLSEELKFIFFNIRCTLDGLKTWSKILSFQAFNPYSPGNFWLDLDECILTLNNLIEILGYMLVNFGMS